MNIKVNKVVVGIVVALVFVLLLFWMFIIRPLGNQDLLDGFTNRSNTYNYAMVKLPNGNIKEGEIRTWKDYDNCDALKIVFKDGTDLVTSYNCAVLSKGKIK